MSIFAEGPSPKDSIDYIKNFSNVNSVLFGSGSETNIKSNVNQLSINNDNR